MEKTSGMMLMLLSSTPNASIKGRRHSLRPLMLPLFLARLV